MIAVESERRIENINRRFMDFGPITEWTYTINFINDRAAKLPIPKQGFTPLPLHFTNRNLPVFKKV